MAEIAVDNIRPPENKILEATDNYVPRNPRIGLTYDKHCVFVLLREHKNKERKGWYFVYDLGYNFGFVDRQKMKNVNSNNDDWRPNVCKVTETYVSQNPDQLSLSIGDNVIVTDRSPTEWYYGICKRGSKKQRGWFSKHYIRERFEFELNSKLTYQFTVQAVHSIQSNNARHLECSAQDNLDVIQRPNTSDTYWLARNTDGKMGLIPKENVNERPELSSVLLKWPWYHQGLSRDDTKAVMQRFLAEPNHFLIRDSEHFPGSFAICITRGGGKPHLSILMNASPDTGYKVNDSQFGSLRDVVNFYSAHAIYIEDGGDNAHYFLLHPIQR